MSRWSRPLSDQPFYALIMAAMRKADSYNAEKLRYVFPEVWVELQERYNAPGGFLREDCLCRVADVSGIGERGIEEVTEVNASCPIHG